MVRAICIKAKRGAPSQGALTFIEFIRAYNVRVSDRSVLNEFISEIVGGSVLFLLLWPSVVEI